MTLYVVAEDGVDSATYSYTDNTGEHTAAMTVTGGARSPPRQWMTSSNPTTGRSPTSRPTHTDTSSGTLSRSKVAEAESCVEAPMAGLAEIGQ